MPPLEVPNYRVVVNSNGDGPATPDNQFTLREAIELTNGSLLYEQLSPQEKGQVTLLGPETFSRIGFNLSEGNRVITLNDILPPLITEGLTIDGTTNPGYDKTVSATAEIEIPVPVVSLTANPEQYIFRGLTVAADKVTIRGLSIYGFTAPQGITSVTPPADIFIARVLPEFPFTQGGIPKNEFPEYDALRDSYFDQDVSAPTEVMIEHNWLGLTPEETMPPRTSAFGVSVFNGVDTIIQHNRISYHEGSGIITSRRANGMKVINNIITANGINGMPDAIRLDGNVDKAQITSNLICGNDGSGVYLFKTEGSITLNENDIKYNGRRLRRAAVYLMGDDHLVVDNKITNQTGPGVVVTAIQERSQPH
ncbi:MAG: right-handed parallel beta-helix repeat-containing protein [Synechococcaceae cyanobacterium RL_1_2]|nr:right-handed parallel beta-helix repeat-containing protein [Synechococcaceae cyanobacterium RL_1_2]